MYRSLQKEFHRRTVALASAAHQLKTPLAILNGYANMMMAEKLGPLTSKQREALQEMQSTRLRLQHFIEDFLNYGAIATGNLKLRIRNNDLSPCLNEVCEIWLPRFQEKLVALYRLEGPEIDPFPFDFYKVQHVVSNLLHNALKFTPSKGTVWILAEPYYWDRRVGAATLKVRKERRRRSLASANSVRVTVCDTGPGISPEYHLEIFEDFSRAMHAHAGNASGTGLGLAVARSLVHAHGGKIWVESEPGAGSKFLFLLPLKPETEEEKSA